MHRRVFVAMVLLATPLDGCAARPQAAIDGTKQAIDAARSAEAGAYAPDSFRTAEEATARFDAELRAQDRKAGFLRSYDKAAELAQAARAAAQRATADAKVAKEAMMQEVIASIDITREAAGYTRVALARLPKTPAAQAAWQSVEGDLAAAEEVLTEAERALSAGKVTDARRKADVASGFVSRAKASMAAAPNAAPRRRLDGASGRSARQGSGATTGPH